MGEALAQSQLGWRGSGGCKLAGQSESAVWQPRKSEWICKSHWEVSAPHSSDQPAALCSAVMRSHLLGNWGTSVRRLWANWDASQESCSVISISWDPCQTHWFQTPDLLNHDYQGHLSFLGFPCGSAGKESTCNVGDLGSIPGLGRSPGEGKGYWL